MESRRAAATELWADQSWKKEKKRKEGGFSGAHQAIAVLHHAFLFAMCNHFCLPAGEPGERGLFLICKMWSCAKQGLPGPPGSSGPPGSPGDPGERVSVSEPCVFQSAQTFSCPVSTHTACVHFVPHPLSISPTPGSSWSPRPSWCWWSARTCWNCAYAACE